MKYVIEVNDKIHSVEIPDSLPQINQDNEERQTITIKVNGQDHEVDFVPGKNFDLTHILIDSQPFELELFRNSASLPETVKIASHPYKVQVNEIGVSRPIPRKKKKISGKIKAFIPGMVVHIPVKEGQMLEQGEVVIILEAMKMENEILSPVKGVVSKIASAPGNKVLPGELLMEIIPEGQNDLP
jgi:biotin carboxyl carrier protein